VFNNNQGSQTFWTFNAGSGLGGPAPVDPNPLDVAYWGSAPPLAIEDSFVGGVNTYYATYGTFSPGTVFARGEVLNSFAGYVNLTDQDGFVAGLPFECTESCSNVIYRPDNGVEEFDWLNTNLNLTTNPMTPTPESSSLVLLGVGIVAAMALYLASTKTQSAKSSLSERIGGS
jgi:hypothetical protein